MAKAKCINLKKEFGKQYKITYDPAFDSKGLRVANLDPWMMQVSCQRGVIYPFGGSTLAVELDGRGPTIKRLEALAGVQPYTRGDRDATFLFDISLFNAVASVVLPRRRRQLTEEQRQVSAARLAKYRKPKKAS